MTWVIVAAAAVLLSLCAAAIVTLALSDRALRRRPGNVPVRIRRSRNDRWSPGHGLWVHDVFAFRGLPGAWKEALVWASEASARPASAAERKRLRLNGEEAIVVTLTPVEGETIDVAARPEYRYDLLGPFAPARGHRTPSSGRALSRKFLRV